MDEGDGVEAFIDCPSDNLLVYYAIPACRRPGHYIWAHDNRHKKLVPLLKLGSTTSNLTVSLAPLKEVNKPIKVNIKVFYGTPKYAAQFDR